MKHTQRGKRLALVLIIIAALLFALIGTAVFPLLSRDANYADRLRQRVIAGLPVGSSEAMVDQWLRTNTKFFPTRNVPPRIDMVQGHDAIELAGMPRDQVASVISTTVPREDVISKFKEDYVRVYFFFDKQGKLIGRHFLSWHDIVAMERDAD